MILETSFFHLPWVASALACAAPSMKALGPSLSCLSSASFQCFPCTSQDRSEQSFLFNSLRWPSSVLKALGWSHCDLPISVPFVTVCLPATVSPVPPDLFSSLLGGPACPVPFAWNTCFSSHIHFRRHCLGEASSSHPFLGSHSVIFCYIKLSLSLSHIDILL